MPKNKDSFQFQLEVEDEHVDFSAVTSGAREVIPVLASVIARLMIDYEDIGYKEACLLFNDTLSDFLEQGDADQIEYVVPRDTEPNKNTMS